MEVLPRIREFFERLPVCRAQHDAGGRVGEDDPSPGVRDHHAFGEVVQYGPEASPRILGLRAGRLLSNQELGAFGLGPLALGHVLTGYEDHRSAIGAPYDANVLTNPQRAAVFALLAGFPTSALFGSPQVCAQVPRYTLSVLFVENVEHRLPDQLLGSVAELRGAELVYREYLASLVKREVHG